MEVEARTINTAIGYFNQRVTCTERLNGAIPKPSYKEMKCLAQCVDIY